MSLKRLKEGAHSAWAPGRVARPKPINTCIYDDRLGEKRGNHCFGPETAQIRIDVVHLTKMKNDWAYGPGMEVQSARA
jgi:hypothetical protein